MNARQKAKKYKRELEQLKKQTSKVHFVEDRRDVRTLTASIHVTTDYAIVPAEGYDNWYCEQLLNQIANSDEFMSCVNIEKIYHPGLRNLYTANIEYRAKVDVVAR